MASLVLGYRKSFLKALATKPDLYLWVEDLEFRRKTWMPKSWKLLRAPYPRSRQQIEEQSWTTHGKPQTVFGITEAAVVSARLCEIHFKKSRLTISDLKPAVALHDKYHMKRIAQRHGIRVIPWAWTGNAAKCEWFVSQISPHAAVVVKERSESGSHNLRIMARHEWDDLAGFETNKIIELYLNAREYSIETLTIDGQTVLQNITEYRIKKHLNVLPAPIDKNLADKIYAFKEKILSTFAITRGLTHVEIYVDENENLYFGEIAFRTPGGYIMDLLSLAYDVDAWSLYARALIDDPPPTSLTACHCAAAWVIHPGEGTIRTIRGKAAVTNMPECIRLRLDAQAGDLSKERLRLSEESGHVILRAENHSELNLAIDRALKSLQIELELND